MRSPWSKALLVTRVGWGGRREREDPALMPGCAMDTRLTDLAKTLPRAG